MTYTPENVNNIKNEGKLHEYIAMERDLIKKIETTTWEETKLSHMSVMLSFAHFHGTYYYGEDFVNANGGVFISRAKSSFGSFAKEWLNFPSLNAAKQYARAALKSHLKQQIHKVLESSKERLKILENAL